MKRLATCALWILGGFAACADGDAVGMARFALGDAAFFRLRIFAEVPTSLAADSLFDTGCLQQQSRTYELSNIPVGSDYTVVYEGFSAASCHAASAVAVGYRGGVSIATGDAPYFHVQVYPSGGVATLPEEINLSASVARAVDFCEGEGDCAADEACYDAAKPEYWCVPTCSSDADCRDIHVRASCDTSAGWCVLRSPFPLNLSEPRAFGAATTLSDGDVLFVGGARQDGVGTLLPTLYPLERFDAQTGLFAAASVAEELPKIGGEFGFTALTADRFVTVGGFVKARLTWSGSGLEVTNESSDVSADVIVWDLSDAVGHAQTTTLARSVARPTVLKLAADRFFVVGGLVVSGPGLETTRATTVCSVSEGKATCEAGPTLVHPRQAPAASCIDEACARVLIVGGNPGGSIAEVVDLDAGTAEALSGTGLPDKLFGGVLCGLDLVAGSEELARSAPFSPLRLSLADGGLTGTVIEGVGETSYLPAVARTGDSCWVAGGLDGTNGIQSNGGRFIRSVDGSVSALAATLGNGRFGAVAAVIGSGLLAGRLVVAGGVELTGNGPVKVVRGAEVLSP